MKCEYIVDIKEKLFKIIAVTAIIANTIGFISNYFLFGMEAPTIVCLCCALSILVLTALGIIKNKLYAVTALILMLVNLVEFPYLYYTYGNSTIVYMVLGFVGAIVFSSKKKRWINSCILIVYDIAVIFISFIFNKNAWLNFKTESIMGATLCSFVIVLVAVYSIVVLWIKSNEQQEKELLKLNEELKHMSEVDALTRVYNRRYLTQYLEKLLVDKKPFFAVILIDVDNFKTINDTYGHVFGDEVLKTLCEIIKSEINEKDVIFRYGGEEFLLVFHDLSKHEIEEKLKLIAEKFRNYSKERKNELFSFSGGAGFYDQEDNITKIFHKVDEKLYEAKNTGKNRVIWS